MPRPRLKPLFEFQGQWISTVPGSECFYRFWTEPGTGRTRRRTLGTANLAKAKVLFIADAMKEGVPTVDTLLAVVLQKYLEALPDEKTKHRRSKNVARGHARKLLAFFGSDAKTKSVTLERQRDFATQCVAKGKYKLSYVARIMTTLHSAFTFSKLKDPEIIYTEPAMEKAWKFCRSEPEKAYVPTDEECLALFDSARMTPSLARWIILSLLTVARPEAVVEISIPQYNQAAGTVSLLVPGEGQNKKYRSIVRAGRFLRLLLGLWKPLASAQSDLRYCGYTSIEGVKSAVERMAKDSGIPISTYSCRQKATTILRKARVSEDEISMFLGHRRKDLRTTAGYGEWDPDYLLAGAQALERWFTQLLEMRRMIKRQNQKQSQAISRAA